jgi:hypothetical protein
MVVKHVIVDGSNIATEGRDAPSLAQLDEAVRAFLETYQPEYVTVVVDATFPNRIDPGERRTYEDAVNANELITPPAGAVGRGDGFVLQIADRASATILSNDSFQEFHGRYTWLFDRGRLIGGKPVPHVGWVFMERVPVRGPTSRRAVSEARKEAKLVDGGEDDWTADEGGAAPRRATKRATAKRTAAKAAKAPAKKAAKKAAKDTAKTPRTRKKAAAAAPEADAPAVGGAVVGDGVDDASGAPPADEALAVERGGGPAGEGYNEALPFIEFVSAHPVGSEVEATIERFSSHGAYARAGDVQAYVPLRYLGDPAPRSAKEVLSVGEGRTFLVMAVDPPRRGIDLGLPDVVGVTGRSPAPGAVGGGATVAADGGLPAGGRSGEGDPEAVAGDPEAVAGGDESAPATGGTSRSTRTAARKATGRKAASRKRGAAASDAPADAPAATGEGSAPGPHPETESGELPALGEAASAGEDAAGDAPAEVGSAATRASARKATAGRKTAAKKAPAAKAPASRKAAAAKAPAAKKADKVPAARKRAGRKAAARPATPDAEGDPEAAAGGAA